MNYVATTCCFIDGHFDHSSVLCYALALKSVSCTVPVYDVSAVNLGVGRIGMHAYQPSALSTSTQASTVIGCS